MLKRITSVGMAFILLFTIFCFQVSANEYEKETRYSYTHSCSSVLSISGLNASCKSSLNGYPNITTKIELTQTLEETFGGISWYYVDSWNTTVYNYYIRFTNTKSPLSSGNYHIKNVAKVYSGSSYETITFYSDIVTN